MVDTSTSLLPEEKSISSLALITLGSNGKNIYIPPPSGIWRLSYFLCLKAAIGSVSLRVVNSKMVSCFSIVRKLPLTPLLPGPIDQDWMTRSDQGSETRPAGSQKQSVVQGAVLVVWHHEHQLLRDGPIDKYSNNISQFTFFF